jgi:hypothetical protein
MILMEKSQTKSSFGFSRLRATRSTGLVWARRPDSYLIPAGSMQG